MAPPGRPAAAGSSGAAVSTLDQVGMTTAAPACGEGGVDSAVRRVANAYFQAGGALANQDLYAQLAPSVPAIGTRAAISGQMRDLGHRQVRWIQQTLRQLGVIERVPERRGHWQATSASRDGIAQLQEQLHKQERQEHERLTPAQPSVVMLACQTELGLSLWGLAGDVAQRLEEPVHLMLSSPPYPLARARAYGGPGVSEYVDWLCQALQPLVRTLAPGGSICLNLSNDIFVSGSPARSTYRERLVIALEDRLGLHKMDELIWYNPQKPPGPTQWASRTRQQLNVAYEPVYWFTNDPLACRADNRRVLQPHSMAHQRLIARGGERRAAVYGDGAYRVRPGSFAAATEGRIARNIITAPPSVSEPRPGAQRSTCTRPGATCRRDAAGAGAVSYRVPDGARRARGRSVQRVGHHGRGSAGTRAPVALRRAHARVHADARVSSFQCKLSDRGERLWAQWI